MSLNNQQPTRDHRVVVLRCETYDRVREVIEEGLDLLGGLDQFVTSGESLLLKPNLLLGDKPERGSTTNPQFFRAVAEVFQTKGLHLSYGDSPGFGSPESAVHASGLNEIADELGITLADFVDGEDVPNPDGHLLKVFHLAKGLGAVDGIINLPKFKTHALTRLTGAVKNSFGCLPGVQKAGFHARLTDEVRFSEMLVDLTELISPRLHIMDGVMGMEGNGPRNGKIRPINVILISANPYALDCCVAKIMNLDPELVPTLAAARRRGLFNPEQLEVLGENLLDVEIPDFDVNRNRNSTTGKPGFWMDIFKNWFTPHPVIDPERCSHCGRCVHVCPATPKAIGFDKGRKEPPQYTYTRCIRCYCCQEMCPEEAISIETPILGRLLNRIRV